MHVALRMCVCVCVLGAFRCSILSILMYKFFTIIMRYACFENRKVFHWFLSVCFFPVRYPAAYALPSTKLTQFLRKCSTTNKWQVFCCYLWHKFVPVSASVREPHHSSSSQTDWLASRRPKNKIERKILCILRHLQITMRPKITWLYDDWNVLVYLWEFVGVCVYVYVCMCVRVVHEKQDADNHMRPTDIFAWQLSFWLCLRSHYSNDTRTPIKPIFKFLGVYVHNPHA